MRVRGRRRRDLDRELERVLLWLGSECSVMVGVWPEESEQREERARQLRVRGDEPVLWKRPSVSASPMLKRQL